MILPFRKNTFLCFFPIASTFRVENLGFPNDEPPPFSNTPRRRRRGDSTSDTLTAPDDVMCSNFFVDFPPHKTHTHAPLTTSSSSSSLGRGEMEESSRRSSRKLQGQHSLLQAATFRSRAILPNQAEGRSSRQQQLLSYFFDVRLLFCSLFFALFLFAKTRRPRLTPAT